MATKISGSSGSDFLDGSGINILEGLEGDDTIIGTRAEDYITGGADEDLVAGDQGNDTLTGDEGDDQLFGGGGEDVIFGNAGNDQINGNEGNDAISAGQGNDEARGGDGDDLISADAGDDDIYGDTGNDRLQGKEGRDYISGGLGNDYLEGNEENDSLAGDQGDDAIYGGAGDDVADGGDANDIIYGEAGNDTLEGGGGSDTMGGGDGNDYLLGDRQDPPPPVIELGTEVPVTPVENFLANDIAQDVITGGVGNDTAIGGVGNDIINGEEGNDWLYGNQGTDAIFGADGNDSIRGGQDNDQLYGDAGVDLILGDYGNDVISGGDGNDSLYGNMGADIVYGNEGNDSLYGGMDNDILQGGKGNDRLLGEIGDDILRGDLGSDTLTGGAGSDRFGISLNTGGATLAQADYVTDFVDGTDFIEIASDLTVAGLTIVQGTGANANNTIIQSKANSQFLLVLQNVRVANITEEDFVPAPPEAPLPQPPGTAGTLQFSAATYQGDEGAPNGIAITVTRTDGTEGAVTATISLAGGNATGGARTGTPPVFGAGIDYDNTNLTVSFGDGDDTAKTILIPINDDATPEPNETFNITLGNATGGATIGTPAAAVVTITDNDNAGVLQFSAPTFSIREDGTAVAAVTVTRTGGSTGQVSGTVTLAGGTATAGTDYTATPITVTFADGQTSEQIVTIPILQDTAIEGNETVNLTLGSPTGGATIGTQNTAVLTLVDDDVPTVAVSPTNSDPDAAEQGQSTGTFVITNTGATPVVVNYTLAGNATNTTDYTITSSNPADPVGQVTVAGNGTATVTVTPVDDVALEGSEDVVLNLTPSAGYNVDPVNNTGTVTIVDNDVPIVEIVPSQPNADEDGPTSGTFTIRRKDGLNNSITAGTLTVNYTVAGSAVSGSDFDPLTGTVTIADGSATATVTVNPVDDGTTELTESVIATLSESTTYSIDPALDEATVNIADNETPTVVVFAQDDTAEEADLSGGSFRVRRLGDLSDPLTVSYAVAGTSTATAGVDYVALGNTLTFAAGVRDQFVTVTPLNDSGSEPEPLYETVTIQVQEGADYLLGTPVQNTVFILNNGL